MLKKTPFSGNMVFYITTLQWISEIYDYFSFFICTIYNILYWKLWESLFDN